MVQKTKVKETKVTITVNRSDGSERAKFDNFDDAILFAKALEKGLKKREIKDD